MVKKSFMLRGDESYYNQLLKIISKVKPFRRVTPSTETYWCVATVYTSGLISGYVLIDEKRNLFEVSKQALRAAIYENKACVLNFRVTVDNRLLPRSYGDILFIRRYKREIALVT